MKFRYHTRRDLSAIEDLFVLVFTDTEGETEGALIGNLVKDLILGTDKPDLSGFVAVDREQIIGAIFFSRLTFKNECSVFLLAPVAIHSDYQGQGIGQKLINHGLREMKGKGVSIVTTYGDRAFYSKVGFRPLSQDVITLPFELSQPEGWLGQSLVGDVIDPIPGRCSPVKAFDNPAYW
jgi:predicted N-acetyltransferase YhbS